MVNNLSIVFLTWKMAFRNRERREKQKIKWKKQFLAGSWKMAWNLSRGRPWFSHTHVPWSVNLFKSAALLSVYVSYSGKSSKWGEFEQGDEWPFICFTFVRKDGTQNSRTNQCPDSANEVKTGNCFQIGLSLRFWSQRSLSRTCLRESSLLSSTTPPQAGWN